MASFAGVDNPFAAGRMPVGGRVLDLGSGGGLDCFVAAEMVGPTGQVIGVDMTPEMLERSRREAARLGLRNVEFRAGILEQLPVPDGWADVVISNGVLNLVADKVRVLREALRALRPGGVIQFADIAVGRSVSDAARCDIELWTDCIAGGLSVRRVGRGDRRRRLRIRLRRLSHRQLRRRPGRIQGAGLPGLRPHLPRGQAVTAPAKTLDAPGLACVDLTPLIAATMRGLRPGDVLEVRTDDPAARLGVPAWCRLTRNPLLGAAHHGPAPSDPSGHRTTFHIAKRESRS